MENKKYLLIWERILMVIWIIWSVAVIVSLYLSWNSYNTLNPKAVTGLFFPTPATQNVRVCQGLFGYVPCPFWKYYLSSGGVDGLRNSFFWACATVFLWLATLIQYTLAKILKRKKNNS